jgi:23S rRNA pseudouridine1911/1915/1917 synthase
MVQEYIFEVSEENASIRLDAYLVKCFSERGLNFSRAFIQRLIQKHLVSIDEKYPKAHHKVRSGEIIKVEVIPPSSDIRPKAENIPLEIIYEDEDLIIINKPRGLVVHPATTNLSGTLVNALLFHFQNLSTINPDRPGIVHRLDKDTAGLMVVARNNNAHLFLAKQFAKHSIKRIYLALVKGEIEFDEGVIDLPIGRHPLKRERMSVSFKDKARYAYTRYHVIKRYILNPTFLKAHPHIGKKISFVELIPQTGRTHQLRVHMASIGHPILGDATYGKKDKDIKLALYAKYLGFIHPRTKKFVEFEHLLPSDMQSILNNTQEISSK